LEEALGLSFDRLLMMMMIHSNTGYKSILIFKQDSKAFSSL